MQAPSHPQPKKEKTESSQVIVAWSMGVVYLVVRERRERERESRLLGLGQLGQLLKERLGLAGGRQLLVGDVDVVKLGLSEDSTTDSASQASGKSADGASEATQGAGESASQRAETATAEKTAEQRAAEEGLQNGADDGQGKEDVELPALNRGLDRGLRSGGVGSSLRSSLSLVDHLGDFRRKFFGQTNHNLSSLGQDLLLLGSELLGVAEAQVDAEAEAVDELADETAEVDLTARHARGGSALETVDEAGDGLGNLLNGGDLGLAQVGGADLEELDLAEDLLQEAGQLGGAKLADLVNGCSGWLAGG